MNTRARRGADEIADSVLHVMLAQYGLSHPREINDWLTKPPTRFSFDLDDPGDLARAAETLRSPIGRIRFHVDVSGQSNDEVHPMVDALRRAGDWLALGKEIDHPLERDDRDTGRRYTSVMTIRTVPSSGVALSSSDMALHQDGLGTAGSVRFVAMCLESGPVSGGAQAYVNVLAQGIRLANTHWKRFVTATSLDALTIDRLTGSQRIRLTGPMFYVDETGVAAASFRSPGGEYAVVPGKNAESWFTDFVAATEEAATHEALNVGDCVVLDNLSLAHARSAFAESNSERRRLARKWYAVAPDRSDVRNDNTLRLHPQIYRAAAVDRA